MIIFPFFGSIILDDINHFNYRKIKYQIRFNFCDVKSAMVFLIIMDIEFQLNSWLSGSKTPYRIFVYYGGY